MNKLQLVMVAGSVLAVGLAPESRALAQVWKPVVLKVNDPSTNDLARTRNGRLQKTQRALTNEQGVVKFFGDGVTGLYVEMRTSALAGGARPVNRMQGACTPIKLTQGADGKVAIEKLPGEKFISDNNGNEKRNFNKPELMPINGGKNMLVMFNYRPQGANNTRRYAKVLDASCNEVPVQNAQGQTAKQVLIMQKNNDNCDMHQSGEGPCDIATDAGGVTHLACWAGCNGNGRDDGWLNDVSVACQNGANGATGCKITKNFDISLCRREERSRGRCSIASADPNTAVCTWTEGNNQPQRDGTWIAAVDITPGGRNGADVQSRLLWKHQVDGQKPIAGANQNPNGNNNGRVGRTYSARAQHSRIMAPAADGALEKTDMLIFQSGDTQGQNRNNQKGGTYLGMTMAVIKASRTGMEYVIPKTNVTDMLLGIDGTHLTMCGGLFGGGTNLIPGVSFLQGDHNGGGVVSPQFKGIGVDLATKKFVDLGTRPAGGSYDRALYSNYLGNNPGNQGRNFAGCTMIKNPFAGVNGETTKYFIAHALTGKSADNVTKPELKPSSYVTLAPIASTISTTQRSLLVEETRSSDAQGCEVVRGKGGLEGAGLLFAGLVLVRSLRRRRA